MQLLTKVAGRVIRLNAGNFTPKGSSDILDTAYALRNSGLDAAGQTAIDVLRKVVGIQAPVKVRIPSKSIQRLMGRHRQRGKRLNDSRTRALTKATPGAPPRRVTGWGQGSIDFEVKGDTVFVHTDAAPYMMILEKHGHPWLIKTLQAIKPELERVAGRKIISISLLAA